MSLSLSKLIILGLAVGLLAGCAAPATPNPTETRAASTPTSIPPYPAPASTTISRPEPIATQTALPPAGGAYPGPTIDPANLPPAVLAAEKALAKKLNISITEITLYAYDQMEWPDGCLGAAERGEICLMMITQGYIVFLQAQDRQYEVHTDDSGNSIRILP